MPTYEYPCRYQARKNIKTRQIKGLPNNLKLHFQSIDIHYYKSEFDKNFFCIKVHLPNHLDDDGYGLELTVFDGCRLQRSDEEMAYCEYDLSDDEPNDCHESDDELLDELNFDDDMNDGDVCQTPHNGYDGCDYEVPMAGLSFGELKQHTQCEFVPVQQGSVGNVLLKIVIKNTAFFGMAYIDDRYLTVVKDL